MASPAAIGLLGNVFGIVPKPAFKYGLLGMMGMYLIAGAHAGLFMGKHVNKAWDKDFLTKFEEAAFKPLRKFIHHWLYWLGLLSGLGGLVCAIWFS